MNENIFDNSSKNKKPPAPKKKRGLEEKMDLPYRKIEIEVPKLNFNENPKDDAYDDYKDERNRLKRLLISGETILEFALEDLEIDRSPKAIDATSNLIKNICGISEKIFDLHKQLRNLKPKQIEEAEMKETEVIETDGDKKTNNISTDINEILNASEENKQKDE